LNEKAIETAKKIAHADSQTAKWVASDALRDLTNDKIQKRLKYPCCDGLNEMAKRV